MDFDIDTEERFTTVSTRPIQYRLMKKKSGKLVLQGYYEWRGVNSFQGEWRDIETVSE
jgi:hypothetical protein